MLDVGFIFISSVALAKVVGEAGDVIPFKSIMLPNSGALSLNVFEVNRSRSDTDCVMLTFSSEPGLLYELFVSYSKIDSPSCTEPAVNISSRKD